MENPFDPGFYGSEELRSFGFGAVGENVQVSKDCVIIGPENVFLGDDVRVDTRATIIATTGRFICEGRNHIGGQCYFVVAADLTFGEFSGTSQGVRIYTSSDDCSGDFLSGPMVSAAYRKPRTAPVRVEKHVSIGAGSRVLPGCTLREGSGVGAMSMVIHSLRPWTMYLGAPAKVFREKGRGALALEARLKTGEREAAA